MPTVSMFLGIIITIYYNDHMPPHFHARYQDCKATFTMDGEPLEGSLPPKQTKFVVAWAALHEDELIANWEIAREHGELFRIDPLR